MKKFPKNARVIFKEKGVNYRGRVTRVESSARRVVTDTGKRFNVSVRRLRESPDRALILEGRLDRNLRSRRTYGPMMKQWLLAYGVEALYEKVHTIEAMHKFLDKEGHNVATRFIHIMAHGTDEPGRGTATLHLTFDQLDLYNQADVFSGLEGKVIILSCCEVGADSRVMKRLKEVSGATAVIGYRLPVDDWYTNLVEALLYDRLINSNMEPEKAVKLSIDALEMIGTKLEGSLKRKPVLVCF